ncbi:hypothetical protein CK203_029443 [Vitis vinifera]|uniref:Uncharacterized protein n=1 Tax=Vitis vinifera TaxID=29760 RepID=A0A438HWV4_VITVI|nr:hypothetical protein CK203_029443 [Vitis vinifera]
MNGEGCLVPFQGACDQIKSDVRSLGGHFLLRVQNLGRYQYDLAESYPPRPWPVPDRYPSNIGVEMVEKMRGSKPTKMKNIDYRDGLHLVVAGRIPQVLAGDGTERHDEEVHIYSTRNFVFLFNGREIFWLVMMPLGGGRAIITLRAADRDCGGTWAMAGYYDDVQNLLTSVNDPDEHIRIGYVGRPDVIFASVMCLSLRESG